MEFKLSWIERMRQIDLAAPAHTRITEQPESKTNPLLHESWIEKLHSLVAEQAAQDADPWRVRLEKLRGTVGIDGVERIATEAVLDVLEISPRARGGGAAARRVVKLMTELGWTATRVRGLRRGVNRDKVRGFARSSSNRGFFRGRPPQQLD